MRKVTTMKNSPTAAEIEAASHAVWQACCYSDLVFRIGRYTRHSLDDDPGGIVDDYLAIGADLERHLREADEIYPKISHLFQGTEALECAHEIAYHRARRVGFAIRGLRQLRDAGWSEYFTPEDALHALWIKLEMIPSRRLGLRLAVRCELGNALSNVADDECWSEWKRIRQWREELGERLPDGSIELMPTTSWKRFRDSNGVETKGRRARIRKEDLPA